MDELVEQFLIEARELLEQAAEALAALGGAPRAAGQADAEGRDALFRAIHTLKGSVGLFDFAPMSQLLHAAEDVLDRLRQDRGPVAAEDIDALMRCLEVCDSLIDAIAESGALPADAAARCGPILAALARRLDASDPGARKVPGPHPDPGSPKAEADWLPAFMARHAAALAAALASAPAAPADPEGSGLTALRYSPKADCFFLGDDPLALLRAVPDLRIVHVEPRAPWSLASFDPYDCRLVFEAVSAAPIAAIRGLFRLVPDQVHIAELPRAERSGPASVRAAAEAGPQAAGPARSLRVDAARIDPLVDVVGELIVTNNSLSQLAGQVAGADPALHQALGALQADFQRLLADLHRGLMGLRMVPLSRAFGRLPRLLRETAAQLGKDVEFNIAGEAIEADKTIVDGLFEPLLHVLRNALDHGIEPPERRAAAGKPSRGRVTLDARKDGQRIEIAVSDDGGGIDPAAVRRIAKARGLMDGDALEATDDTAALALIFAPGFSTAAAVTSVSGRGVGLDAVRTAVAALGGSVTARSQVGAGTTIRLILPQTLALATLLTVEVGPERYAIPIEAVAETARIAREEIVSIAGGRAFVRRDRTLPLLNLAALLGLPPVPGPAADGSRHAAVLIVETAAGPFGVAVDRFAERLTGLVRPLTGLLSQIPGVSGTALGG